MIWLELCIICCLVTQTIRNAICAFVEYIQNSFRTYVTEVVTHRPSLTGRRDMQTKYDACDLYYVNMGRGSGARAPSRNGRLRCLTSQKWYSGVDLTHCQWCGLRPSVLGQDRSETKKIDLARCGLGLGLAGLVLCCETRSCHARRHNDLEGHRNFSSTIYCFSILYLEHHYCGDQQWPSLTCLHHCHALQRCKHLTVTFSLAVLGVFASTRSLAHVDVRHIVITLQESTKLLTSE